MKVLSTQNRDRLLLGRDWRKPRVLGFVGSGVTLFVWAILSLLIIPGSLLVPSPIDVVVTIEDLGPTLFVHIAYTIARIVIGFSLGVLLGFVVALSMQYNGFIYGTMSASVEMYRPVPVVALIPFVVLLFGFSEYGKIFIAVLGTSLVSVVFFLESMGLVGGRLYRYGLAVGLSRISLFRRIVIPASMPFWIGGLRIALAICISLVVVSEFLGATYGIGYLINVSKVTLNTSTMLTGIIVIGIIGWVLDAQIRALMSYVTSWHGIPNKPVI